MILWQFFLILADVHLRFFRSLEALNIARENSSTWIFESNVSNAQISLPAILPTGFAIFPKKTPQKHRSFSLRSIPQPKFTRHQPHVRHLLDALRHLRASNKSTVVLHRQLFHLPLTTILLHSEVIRFTRQCFIPHDASEIRGYPNHLGCKLPQYIMG